MMFLDEFRIDVQMAMDSPPTRAGDDFDLRRSMSSFEEYQSEEEIALNWAQSSESRR